VASGKIIFRGRAGGRGGGFGNLIKIQHDNGYISYYGHLNGFAGGLKVGDRVQQKQVIGYVGSTGLATGPHVCFRIQKNGSFVNPMKIKSPAAARIAKENWTDFEGKRDEILRFMNGSRLAANESKPST
jgi:murein DD-endopeptidase MepM/ murein hydrolase activator NlpD